MSNERRRTRNMITGGTADDDFHTFCSKNNLSTDKVNKSVLDSLCSIRSVADVLNNAFIRPDNKVSLFASFYKAKDENSPRAWLTQGINEPLIFTEDKTYSHTFDACPMKLLSFIVHPDSRVYFNLMLSDYQEVRPGADRFIFPSGVLNVSSL